MSARTRAALGSALPLALTPLKKGAMVGYSMQSFLRSALLCFVVGSFVVGCGAATPPARTMDANARNARSRALIADARTALRDHDMTRAHTLVDEVVSLGAPAFQDELATLRVDIDEVEAPDVAEASFKGAKAKGDCSLGIFEVARHIEARRGTAFEAKLQTQAQDAASACLVEIVAARLGAGDIDGARKFVGDDRVKAALGVLWKPASDPLIQRITAVEEQRARESANAVALQDFKALVTTSLGKLTIDTKKGTISYDGLVTDMQNVAFKKLYPKATKLPPESAILEKHFPGRVLRLQLGAGECAACTADSFTIAHIEFTNGRLSEALVQRRGGNGPATNFFQAWNAAFRETVRSALSGRFPIIEEIDGQLSTMFAYLTPRGATGAGPAISIQWSVRDGSVLLSLRVMGDAVDAKYALDERAVAAEVRAAAAAEAAEVRAQAAAEAAEARAEAAAQRAEKRALEQEQAKEQAQACSRVRVGMRWSIRVSVQGPAVWTVVALNRSRGTATVKTITPGMSEPEIDEWLCSDVPEPE